MSVVGAILTGGMSTRMGRDKMLMPFRGDVSLVQMVERAVRPCVSSLVLVGRSLPGVDAPVIVDRRPHEGPLAALESLLSSAVAAAYLVVPCDMPLLTPELLRLLCDENDARSAHDGVRVFCIEGEERARPLPMYIRSELRVAASAALDRGERALRVLLGRDDCRRVHLAADQADSLAGANTPEEFDRLARVAATSRR